MKRIFASALLSSALVLSACAEETVEAPEAADVDMMAAEESGSIVEVAQGNPDFSTLVTAVVAADLAETLSGPGPFTVFAPVNSAFDALPEGTLATLTAPENQGQLAGILTYHVVAGETTAAALVEAINTGGGEAVLTTVNGASLTATINADGGVTLTDAAGNTANVTMTDVDASNGVIHVIDTVLMPS